MAESNTVLLHGRDSETKDGVANAAVTPGELLELAGVNSDGDRQFQPHSAAAGSAMARFATEYAHTGMTIDDDYASGEHMEYRPCYPGDEVFAFVAAGENVAAGDKLVSAGNGALQAAVGDGTEAAVHVAEAVEAVDNSGGASAVRLAVEVL